MKNSSSQMMALEARRMLADVSGPLYMLPSHDGLGGHTLTDGPGGHNYSIVVTASLGKGTDTNYYLEARINRTGDPKNVEVVTFNDEPITELTINAGNGNDNFRIKTSNLNNLPNFFSKNIEIQMQSGNDRVEIDDPIGYVYGGVGNDTIYGSNAPDGLVGGSGNDYIIGKNGNDLIHPGPGWDTVLAGGGDDSIYYFEVELNADFYRDQIVGGTGFDTILGLYDTPGGITLETLTLRTKRHGIEDLIVMGALG